MTVASEIQRIEGNISAAYTAADAKGATMPATENSDNLATCISSIPAGGGSGKYQLLERIKDDSNNEIGTVSGFFTDANDVEYAVVCLDADKRTTGAFVSASGEVTNLPLYITSDLYSTTETATYNTQTILDYCTAKGYTSTACTRCRNNSFIIDGVTHYGQLPNIVELVDIYRNRVQINLKDTSGGNKIISNNLTPLSSNQNGSTDAWMLSGTGNIGGYYAISSSYDVIPVLELPNS
mgnify:CR=1 FL=1